MAAPSDASQPRLATGCRWGAETKAGTAEERVILFPEGAIKLQGTGRQVLEQCDGQRTFAEIIAELQKQFGAADPAKPTTNEVSRCASKSAPWRAWRFRSPYARLPHVQPTTA